MSPQTGPITGEEILQVLPRSSTTIVTEDQSQLPSRKSNGGTLSASCKPAGNKTKPPYASDRLQDLLAKLKNTDSATGARQSGVSPGIDRDGRTD